MLDKSENGLLNGKWFSKVELPLNSCYVLLIASIRSAGVLLFQYSVYIFKLCFPVIMAYSILATQLYYTPIII